MLSAGRIPHTEAEGEAIARARLHAKHPDAQATITRRDPGETGPLLVHIGDNTWTIDAAGRIKSQKAAA